MVTRGAGDAFGFRYMQSSSYVPHGHVNYTRPSQSGMIKIEKNYYCGGQPMGGMDPWGVAPPPERETNWWGVAIGAVLGFFGARAGHKAQQRAQMQQMPPMMAPGQPPNPAGNTNELQNLRQLFQSHGYSIVQNADGTFTATDKNGKVIGPADYNTMCQLCSANKGSEETQGGNTNTDNTENTNTGNTNTGNTNTDNNTGNTNTNNNTGNSPASASDNVETNTDNTSSNTQKPRKTGGSPKGWYRATADKNSAVNGIKLEDLQNAQKGKLYENGKTRNKTAAEYVLARVLDTKMLNTLSPNQKADLLKQIIAKNPSVFNSDGTLKEGVTQETINQKLDVPSISWIKQNYGIKDGPKEGTSVAQEDSRTQRGEKTVAKGQNGYYATKDKNGKIRYYDPNHTEITPGSFKNHCPNIYKNLNK